MPKLFFYLSSTIFFSIFTLLILKKTASHLKTPNKLILSYSNSSFDPQGNNLEEQLFRLPKTLQNQIELHPRYTFTKVKNPLIVGSTSSYLKIDNQNYYGSPQGREELNQNIREICAFNMKKDNYSWLGFINGYNQGCQKNQDEHCWEDQANQFNFDIKEISQCFNKNGGDIVTTEVSKPLLLKPILNSSEIDIPEIYDKIYSQNAN